MTARKSNIELLRIICMFIIVLNHYVSRKGIVETFDGFNFNSNIAHLFRSAGYPALVAFVLISGYFMAGEGRFRTKRVLSVLVQVTAFSVISLIAAVFVLYIHPGRGEVLRSFIPYLYGYDAYWFVGPYIGMCLLAPFIDLLTERCGEMQHRLLILLSALPVFVISTWRGFSMSNERNGILTFVIIYIIASYIKKYRVEERVTIPRLILILTGFLALSYSIYPLGHLLKTELYNNIVLDMNNIFSLVTGVSFFMLFLKIDVNTNRVINYFAGSMFGVYLFHENFLLRGWIWGTAVNRAAYYSSNLFLVHCFATVSLLFITGICFDIIISYLIRPLLESAAVGRICTAIDSRINSSFPAVNPDKQQGL